MSWATLVKKKKQAVQAEQTNTDSSTSAQSKIKSPSAPKPALTPWKKRVAEKPSTNEPLVTNVDLPTDVVGTLDQYAAAMETHLAHLSQLKTLDEKARYKQQNIAPFMHFVRDYIEQGHHYPNAVALWTVVWCFDIGDIENAMDFGLHLVDQNQDTPAKFASNLATVMLDNLYDWAASKIKAGQSPMPYLADGIKAMDYGIENGSWDLYEPVPSKMFALAAKQCMLDKLYESAISFAEKAQKLNDKAGVKGIIKKATKAREKHTKVTEQPPETPEVATV